MINRVTSAQIRAARGLLNWSVRKLSEQSGIHRNTITNLETNRSSGDEETLAKLRDTMEGAGVIFVQSNGDGPGVRVRKLAEGDRVQFKPESHLLPRFPVEPPEIGEVTVVEAHPAAKHSGYRISVRFKRTIVPGVPADHFVLVEAGKRK